MTGSRRFRHGLVIGKFYPFHAGHQALVRAATSSCDRVTVEVMVQGVESIPAAVRVEWVQDEHPDARVVAAFDDAEVDFDSAEVWDLHLAVIESHLDGPVDAVFTSDAYGVELARRLGAAWVQVDPGRASTPISGTAIRRDPEANWWALPTPVRRWFTKRVVVLGTEATGSAALARALGKHYDTAVVMASRREWAARGPEGSETPWHQAELALIAREQAASEDQAAGRVRRPLLFCERDLQAATLWHQQVVPQPSPTSAHFPAARPAPALYVVTGTALPHPMDGTHDVPWVEVRGRADERLAAAATAIDDVVDAGWNLADPLG